MCWTVPRRGQRLVNNLILHVMVTMRTERMVRLGHLAKGPRYGGMPPSASSPPRPYSSRHPSYPPSALSLSQFPRSAPISLRCRPLLHADLQPLGSPLSAASFPCRRFCTSPVMAAARIDGTAIARSIREGLKDEIVKIQQSNPRFKPSLVIFQGAYYILLRTTGQY